MRLHCKFYEGITILTYDTGRTKSSSFERFRSSVGPGGYHGRGPIPAAASLPADRSHPPGLEELQSLEQQDTQDPRRKTEQDVTGMQSVEP